MAGTIKGGSCREQKGGGTTMRTSNKKQKIKKKKETKRQQRKEWEKKERKPQERKTKVRIRAVGMHRQIGSLSPS